MDASPAAQPQRTRAGDLRGLAGTRRGTRSTPTAAEIADQLELSDEEVIEALLGDQARKMMSLNVPVSREDSDAASWSRRWDERSEALNGLTPSLRPRVHCSQSGSESC